MLFIRISPKIQVRQSRYSMNLAISNMESSQKLQISQVTHDIIDLLLDSVCFGFKSDDFKKIFEFSGKECLATEFQSKIYILLN